MVERSKVYQLFHLLGIDTDPDRDALDADPDCIDNPCFLISLACHNIVEFY
jgi:hypothetical protein